MRNPYAWHPELKKAIGKDDAGIELIICRDFNPQAMRQMLWFLNEYTKLAHDGRAYPDSQVDNLFRRIKLQLGDAYDRRTQELDDQWEGEGDIEDQSDYTKMAQSNVDQMEALIEVFKYPKSRTDKVIAIDHFAHAHHFGGTVTAFVFGESEEADYWAKQVYAHLFSKRNPTPSPYRIAEYKAMYSAFHEYVKLAHEGKNYPDYKVNLLFQALKTRLRHAEYEPRDYDQDRRMLEDFNDARTRTEKVLAIDALMSMQHGNGLVFTRLFSFCPQDLAADNQEFTPITEHLCYQADRDIREKLGHLFAKRNPTPTSWTKASSNYAQFIREHSKPEHAREHNAMWKALREYEALAAWGKRYPTHRVDTLFTDLKKRLNWQWDHRWYEDASVNEGESPIRELVDEFADARTRTEKVLAIDHLMHLQHWNGMVLVALYKSSPDIFQITENQEVMAFLEKLSQKRNPLPYTEELMNDPSYRQMMWALAEYTDLAVHGNRYPNHRVNRLFNKLEEQWWHYDGNEDSDEEDHWLHNIYAAFMAAKAMPTRLNKVVAIDTLMNAWHCNGNRLTDIFGFHSDDDDYQQQRADAEAILKETGALTRGITLGKFKDPKAVRALAIKQSKEILDRLFNQKNPYAYHGTRKKFKKFDPKYIKDLGFHFGTPEQALDRVGGFTIHPGVIKLVYLDIKKPYDISSDLGAWDDMGMLEEYFAKSNEGPIPDKAFKDGTIKTPRDVAAYLERLGYDGIAYDNAFEGVQNGERPQAYIVWDTSRIKIISEMMTSPYFRTQRGHKA